MVFISNLCHREWKMVYAVVFLLLPHFYYFRILYFENIAILSCILLSYQLFLENKDMIPPSASYLLMFQIHTTSYVLLCISNYVCPKYSSSSAHYLMHHLLLPKIVSSTFSSHFSEWQWSALWWQTWEIGSHLAFPSLIFFWEIT